MNIESNIVEITDQSSGMDAKPHVSGICYHSDYKNGIDLIENNSIDLLLTDPPYLHEKGGMKCERFNNGVYAVDSMTTTEMSDFDKDEIYTFLNLVAPKMKKFNAYIFCSKLQIPYYLNYTLENKLKFDIHVWEKNQFVANQSQFARGTEYIVRIYDNGCGLNAGLPSKYYFKVKHNQQVKNKTHESEKPISLLYEYVLLSTKENDTILDLFGGSGSTAITAIKAKRKFIIFEKVKEIFIQQQKNIQKELSDNRLF